MRRAFAREQNAFATVHVIRRQICATARVWILEEAAVDIVAPMVIAFARSKILWMQFSGQQHSEYLFRKNTDAYVSKKMNEIYCILIVR